MMFSGCLNDAMNTVLWVTATERFTIATAQGTLNVNSAEWNSCHYCIQHSCS